MWRADKTFTGNIEPYPFPAPPFFVIHIAVACTSDAPPAKPSSDDLEASANNQEGGCE
jgi:hypothetical protein